LIGIPFHEFEYNSLPIRPIHVQN